MRHLRIMPITGRLLHACERKGPEEELVVNEFLATHYTSALRLLGV